MNCTCDDCEHDPLAALRNQAAMHGTAAMPEINYRETQYGIRTADGEIRPAAVGPAEAERYRAAGVDVYCRERIVYWPTESNWCAVARPAANRPDQRDRTESEER